MSKSSFAGLFTGEEGNQDVQTTKTSWVSGPRVPSRGYPPLFKGYEDRSYKWSSFGQGSSSVERWSFNLLISQTSQKLVIQLTLEQYQGEDRGHSAYSQTISR